MIEHWRRWRYKRYESRVSGSDDFAEFEKLFSGPWTPDLVRKMPWDVLLKGPGAQIDPQTRKIIDLEVGRRLNSTQPVIANFISFFAFIVAVIALFRTN